MPGDVQRRFTEIFAERAKTRKDGDGDDFRMSFNVMRMRRKTYLDYVAEISDVRRKYMNHAHLEYKALPGDEVGSAYVSNCYDFFAADEPAPDLGLYEGITELA